MTATSTTQDVQYILHMKLEKFYNSFTSDVYELQENI